MAVADACLFLMVIFVLSLLDSARLRTTVSQSVYSQSYPVMLNDSTVSAAQLAPAFEGITHEFSGVDHNTYGPLAVARQTNNRGIIDK